MKRFGMANSSIVLIAALMWGLPACSTMKPPRQLADQSDQMIKPEPNIWISQESIESFGKMLRGYPYIGDKPTLIYITRLVNSTSNGDLPHDFTQMLLTAIAQIGEPIYAVRINDEHRAYNSDGQLMLPPGMEVSFTVELRGSITECDRKVMKMRDVHFNLLFPYHGDDFEFGAGGRTEVELTTIAIDLQLFNVKTQTAIPGMAISYRVNILEHRGGFDVGILYDGSGIGITQTAQIAQGPHLAIRLATQGALIQLLGRYFNVPFYRCIDAPPDPKVERSFRNLLNEVNPTAMLKQLLFAHGYPMDLDSPHLDQDEMELARRLKEQMGFGRNGGDYNFIKELWETVPLDKAEERMSARRRATPRLSERQQSDGGAQDYIQPSSHSAGRSRRGHGANGPAQTANAGQSSAAPPTARNFERLIPRAFSLQLGNTDRSTVFRERDPLKLTVQSQEDCYIAVILHQADGRSTLLFPSREADDLYLAAGRTESVDLMGKVRIRAMSPAGGQVVQVVGCTRESELRSLIRNFETAPQLHSGNRLHPPVSRVRLMDDWRRVITSSHGTRWSSCSLPIEIRPEN